MQQIVIGRTWRDRVEEAVAHARESRLLVFVVAGVAVVSLLLWARTPEPRIAPPARASMPAFVAPSSASTLVVHVAGAVRAPGLYRFPSGARIADAIETAGGPLRAADLTALNLAAALTDGTQVLVPERGDPADSAPGAPGPEPSAATVPLNSADQAALETIPGVGPVTAGAILEHRERVGSFASVDELLDVDGIGPATLEAIRPYVTL